jgi:hypothetical protein
MRSLSALVLVFALLMPESGAAQSGNAVSQVLKDSTAAAVVPVAKKKGLFGKVKGLAKNKVVKTVAKAALCTAVPGGQVIASALDAKETKNVKGAAAAAATGGSNCMPGMAGMASPPAGALGASVPGAGLPGQPSTGMPAMAMSPEQMKQMQDQYAKMGMDTAQLRAMQQMMAAMPGAFPTEGATGPGEPAGGAPALSREKGKMVLRQLPWVAASDALVPGGELAFAMAIHQVALAIPASSSRYKIEARVEDQGGKSQSRLLSQKRARAVVRALAREGIAAERLTMTDGGSDKDPRIIVSERK